MRRNTVSAQDRVDVADTSRSFVSLGDEFSARGRKVVDKHPIYLHGGSVLEGGQVGHVHITRNQRTTERRRDWL